MPEILNYAEFLRTDDNSLQKAARETTLLGLRNFRKGQQTLEKETDGTEKIDVMSEKKGTYLDFMDQLSDIQNNIEALTENPPSVRSGDDDDESTLPNRESPEYFNPGLFDVNDISELAYESPNSPHFWNNDSDEEEEEDEEEAEIEIHPRHRRNIIKKTNAMLTRKTIHLINKARTFFRIQLKPIFSDLNAEDMAAVKRQCMQLGNSISEFGIPQKLINAMTKLIETVMITANSYTSRKGDEIYGGSSFRKQEYKTLPTRFNPVYNSIDKKYML